MILKGFRLNLHSKNQTDIYYLRLGHEKYSSILEKSLDI